MRTIHLAADYAPLIRPTSSSPLAYGGKAKRIPPPMTSIRADLRQDMHVALRPHQGRGIIRLDRTRIEVTVRQQRQVWRTSRNDL
jgi:hypothetical protein